MVLAGLDSLKQKNAIRNSRKARVDTQTKTPKIIYSYNQTPLAHEAPFKENMKRKYDRSSVTPKYGMMTKRTPQPSHFNGIRRFQGSQPTATRDHKFPLPTNQTRTINNSAPSGRPFGGGI